jgi:DNA polymerase V
MIDKGIQDGDILVVDKSLNPENNSTVIAYIDGEFTVKRFVKERNEVILYPANSNYEPITVTDENDFLVWGVVTYVLHKCI